MSRSKALTVALLAVLSGATSLVACNTLLGLREADLALEPEPEGGVAVAPDSGVESDDGLDGGGDAGLVDASCFPRACAGDQDCCPGGVCYPLANGLGGQCGLKPGCFPRVCAGDQDCCPGAVCNHAPNSDGLCVLKPGAECKRGPECISGTCTKNVCECGRRFSVCMDTKDCCGGFVCSAKGFTPPLTTGNCCLTTHAPCDAGLNCCSLRCSSQGACLCALTGRDCATGADCCSGNCSDNYTCL